MRGLKAGICVGLLGVCCSAALAASLGGPLNLRDEGIFYVNVKEAPLAKGGVTSTVNGGPVTAEAGGTTITNRAYAQFRIPMEVKFPPIVMIGGSGDTGATYETTPDGREGWATYFARNGFPVYTVDGPGRGRSGINVAPFVRAKAANDASLIPDLNVNTKESQWAGLRIGPKYPEMWPDSQFPIEAMDQFSAQFVPNAEILLGTPEEARNLTVDALIAVLEKSGPGILLVHSQSGLYGFMAMERRPDLVKGIIATEGSCIAVTKPELATYNKEKVEAQLLKTPFLSIFGAHSEAYPDTWNGIKRREACRDTVGRVRKAGGPSTLWVLPDLGIKGNSHAMALEKNNLQIADKIFDWVRENVK